ncbi:GTP pyrophosphokinase family protein [Dermacoccus nishinomiyaensis]|uniref:GTP pyrophosphokinase n=1 Tax=Dermacoccus nishinomiyaensis TaxID=1274 RepID=UPI000E00C6E9|nr:GTP pyrophosphokinase family protein [Dermacoccus nishinomiyaensis]NHC31928.1 GTP pyrophosphokinase family protein [Dermacoccus nishinomiyaensis]QQY24994.1 GTP pyrophosphokinase family protein [Dermacoccus nishinomiyaensis]STD17948.1 GTP pyrophosphokinase ywaC [Dermacoccus nishinomiyaensis]
MPRPILSAQEARERIAAVEQFMVAYRSAIDEIGTKLRVLQREFTHTGSYSPIESVSTRLKSMESLLRKARKRDCRHLDDVRARVTDIAGIRVICSFTHDVYRVRDLLLAQDDVTLLEQKDYVAHPKPNGYRSLHLIVEVPAFLSTGPQPVPVEVQLRTIAMDFWASLEHKIYYQYDGDVPAHLLSELTTAAHTASRLDADMERLHHEFSALRTANSADDDHVLPEMLQLISYFDSSSERH